MKKLAALAAVLCLFATGCGDLLDPAAAVVRGEKITIDEVQAVVDGFTVSEAYREAQARGESVVAKRQFERNYLSQLIRREVLAPEAEGFGISITEADVEKEIESIKADFGTPDLFQEALREEGLTPLLLRSLVADSLLEDALRSEVTKDAGPSEEQLIDYYDAHIENYKEKRASHILVEKEDLAKEISAQLDLALPDKVDDLFVDLAKRYSKDETSAERGGDLGWFGEGAFVPEFEKTLNSLKEYEFSAPVRTEFGWHIILLTGKRTKSFAQVRDDIEVAVGNPMIDQAWLDWLEQTYAAAEVEVNPRYGVFDVASQTIADPDESDVPGAAIPSEEPTQPLPAPTG